MKKTILIFIILMKIFSAISAQTNAVEKLFSSEIEKSEFKFVSISEKMFGSISKSEENNADVKEVVSNLKGLKVLQTKTNPTDFFNQAKSRFSNSSYEEYMAMKEKGSNVVFYVSGLNGKYAKELVLMVGSKENTVILDFIGNINLDKISKLAKAFNLEGADKLDKLGK